MDKNLVNKSVMTAFFRQGDVVVTLMAVSEEEMDKMTIDEETGREKEKIYGYPMCFSPSKRLFPYPEDGIEVFYG